MKRYCLIWRKTILQFPVTAARDAIAPMAQKFTHFFGSINIIFLEKTTGRLESLPWESKTASGGAKNVPRCHASHSAQERFGYQMR